MPASEQILAGLSAISNDGRPIAAFWHVFFALLAVLLICGKRLSRKTMGILLALPLISVSVAAWLANNPFNGIVFASVGVLMAWMSLSRLKMDGVSISAPWFLIPGIVMIAFGWVYPHFLESGSVLKYLAMAPTGLIPCPTLSIVIGFALVLRGLESRAVSWTLGLAGLFFGLIGTFRLGVGIDAVLILGALLLLAMPFLSRRASRKTPSEKTSR